MFVGFCTWSTIAYIIIYKPIELGQYMGMGQNLLYHICWGNERSFTTYFNVHQGTWVLISSHIYQSVRKKICGQPASTWGCIFSVTNGFSKTW